jgi:hypothetical protein
LNQNDFDDLFDIFEYFVSLNFMKFVENKLSGDWCPWGQFLKRNYYARRGNEKSTLDSFFAKAEIEKDGWLPIEQGMFEGSYAKYSEIKNRTDSFLKKVNVD